MTSPLDWDLERLAAGEKPPVGPLDDAALQRLEALRRSDAEILAYLPPARVAAEVRRRLETPRRAPWLWLAVPAMAAAVFVLAPRPTVLPPVIDRGATTRIKGPPELSIYRQTENGPEHLLRGASVRPGDTVQLRYVSAGRSYGAVISVDGAGVVTLHYPDRVGDSTALRPDGAPLRDAYQLDDSPGFERFFFIASTSPLDVGKLLDDARALAAHAANAEHDELRLSQAAEQVDFLLIKANP